VKKTVWLVALLSLLLVAGACQGRARQGGNAAATETIAPPAPQPAPTGTDAMTQTVDVEDSRSEDDGGVLTSPQTAKVPGATTTATKAATKSPAKKKTKK
jgi:hypothetical protein